MGLGEGECNVLVPAMENTSSPSSRGSVIVSRPVRNVDRLTYSSYHHSHSQPGPGQDWNLQTIEQRLAQPSLSYRRSPSPSHLHTIQAMQETEKDRINLDEIYSKFSDLVKSNLITDETDKNLIEEENPEELEEETIETDKRPVSDCHVCGDKAIAHLHYGGICCYSCKAFFRRAVQNGKDKSYKCKAGRSCPVSVETRRGCQKCRFDKCLAVGMTASWVLSDEQCQIRFGKAKTKRKVVRSQTKIEESREPAAKLCHHDNTYTQQDTTLVHALMEVYEGSKEKISFSDANERMLRGISHNGSAYSASEMNEMVNTVIKRNIYFMENTHHFSVLSHEDKRKLLTKNMTEMCHIRGALKFNPKTASFDMEPRGQPCPRITQESIKNLYSSVNTARDIFKLMSKLSDLQLPSEVMILLIPVVSLSSDGLILERKTFVEDSQVEYLNLIYR